MSRVIRMIVTIADEVWSFSFAVIAGLLIGSTVAGLIIGTLYLAHAIKL